MAKHSEILLKELEVFVKEYFKNYLPKGMFFHNLEHTLMVVENVKELIKVSNINNDEQLILVLAAYLHDLGYCQKYDGHEFYSADIAVDFLEMHGVKINIIELVKSCILATQFPQHPKNEIENIICDADLYHFSLNDYQIYADKLRMEWKYMCRLNYSDQEWDKLNLKLLSDHQFFTQFGQQILQKKKEKNFLQLVQQIS